VNQSNQCADADYKEAMLLLSALSKAQHEFLLFEKETNLKLSKLGVASDLAKCDAIRARLEKMSQSNA
jgi:hypothetical protein